MARQKEAQSTSSPRRRRGPADRFRPRKYTRITVDRIDYKDLTTIRRFLSDKGKLRSRRVTGLSRRHQRQLAVAVKRAREIGLLPFVGERWAMAEAILLKDVEDLGAAGDAVDVSPGYLRNYLVPRKLAQPATKGALEDAMRRRAVAEKTQREQEERAGETAALLSKTVLTINHRAGEDGKLFGSVTTKEIAEAIGQARGIKVDRKKVRLEQPIREVGTYMVEIEVAGGTTAKVKTIVAAASS